MRKDLFLKNNRIVPFEQSSSFYYRKALKFTERTDYINALDYFRRAHKIDPDNTNCLVNIAEIYTEINHFEKSNQILFSLFSNKKASPDIYFDFGCNFLGLQDYEKAQECFEKYLETQPEGSYFEEAKDLLSFLINKDYFYDYDLKESFEPSVYKQAEKGKHYLNCGDYDSAINVFEDIVKVHPDIIFIRNNLSLAYFCKGNVKDAEKTANKVLKEFPENIHANCNMSIFLKDMGRLDELEKHAKKLDTLTANDVDELYKLAITHSELRNHSKAYDMFKKLLTYKPYDVYIIHYAAVASFNTCKYKKAINFWHKIDKILPDNYISSYYRRKAQSVNDGSSEFKEISYHFQVPYNEIFARIRSINEKLRLSHQDIMVIWNNDLEFRHLLKWGLGLSDKKIKTAILNLISSFNDSYSEAILREFILVKNEDDDLKKEAIRLLKKIEAKEPYVACIDGKIKEINVSVVNKGFKLSDNVKEVVKVTLKKMKRRYGKGFEDEVKNIWAGFVSSAISEKALIIRKKEAWAAALELYYCIANDIYICKKELANYYSISYNSLLKNYKRISSVLDS